MITDQTGGTKRCRNVGKKLKIEWIRKISISWCVHVRQEMRTSKKGC